EYLKHLGRLIAHVANYRRLVERQLVQTYLVGEFNLSIAVGNRIAMRIEPWIAKIFIQLVDEFFASHMFEVFCYRMHFIPGEFQLLREEEFPESVTTNDQQCEFAPFIAQS